MARRVCVRCDLPRNANYFTPQGKVCSICRKETAKNLSLCRLYGIDLGEYKAMLAYQGYVCAGCGEARKYLLHVDHDHILEKVLGVRNSVRGLLCKNCNQILRRVRDNIPLLRALILYLQDPPARKVLQ